MHRASLRAAGFSAYRIGQAIDAGTVVRAGRDRVVVPELPKAQVVAASLGVRLTCVSAMQSLGLWARNDTLTHVSAPRGYSPHRDSTGLKLHWARTPMPVGRDAAVEPLINALVHVAWCQPIDYAVASFDAALNRRAISQAELRQLATVLGGRFAQAVALSDPRADSGGETLTRIRCADCGIVVKPQVVIDGHRVDGLIGRFLIVQIDGFTYHDATQRAKDLAQDRRLALRGHTVLRFPSAMVEQQWDAVLTEIRHAMAQGLHEHPSRGDSPRWH